ncbi:unnamed protein product, partial [Rotaria magnacalcarata]
MRDIVNEKPPYRRFYFMHHIAYAGNREEFDKFNDTYQFDLNLCTNDDKSIVDIANDAGHAPFARYVSRLKERNQPQETSNRFSRESRTEERAHARDSIMASTSRKSDTIPVPSDDT